ncbi:bifunctional diguanylate cyclase/phosphodiesterase [Tunturibacter empetritectus]|uniref:diguanylate cyclase n=1 Tax=Tunturiibacter lichenicola TaxID=2051959 RepID=A0A7W8N4Z7_9BACT|nr:diguanylate cyclase [Edaphobacter lichenicola]MBB5345033.1 diguanylate cyclase (GGDEF)-like protein/PAS domain S-box-containing protein [Edaphobacter lichenicola]
MSIGSLNETVEERGSSLWRLTTVALVLVCLGYAALLLNIRSWDNGGVTILWPSNGLLLGVLLCSRRRQWAAFLAVGFAVDLGLNLGLTFAPWTSVYLAGCNMLEVGIAAALMYRTISPNPDLTRRRQLMSLLLFGVVLAPAIASALAQLSISNLHAVPRFTAARHWFVADALGIAVMTPLYLSFREREQFPGRSRLEVAGLLSLLVVAALGVFWQTRFPLLFLLLPVLLLLGARLRLAGSALGLLIVSIIGGYLTIRGRGPIALVHTGSPMTGDLLLQFFVAVSMLVLYVVEVVIAERERLQVNLKSSETLFRLLAEASNDVIVLSDLSGARRYVSPAVITVLGWEPGELVGQTHLQIVHPDDLAAVEALMRACREGEPVEALIYRCARKDGSYVWMEASMRLYHDETTWAPIGFVNVVRDVTARKAAEEELNRAFRLVENLAMADGLTGVANRRRFEEKMDNEWRRAMRDRSLLSVLMMDVDHFKPYNDLYGHVMGDSCLRQIAVAAQEVIHRSSDLFARYGGEEFVAVLPNTDSGGAQLVAEQIRRAVEMLGLPHSGSPSGVVTVSIGCATKTLGHDSTSTELVDAADQALYQAKSAGRNRVEVAATSTILG